MTTASISGSEGAGSTPTLNIQAPIIDWCDLVSEQPEARERSKRAIIEGFGSLGLLYVRGHQLDVPALDRFYDRFLALTKLPEATKDRYAGHNIWYQRGWTPPNTEKAVVAGGQPDFKECWFAAPEPLDPVCALQFPEVFAENVWPAEIVGFEETYLEVGRATHQVGLALLSACEQALGLPDGALTTPTLGAAHVTRALRYLPLTEELVQQGVLWGEEHTDFNLLTLLPGGRFYDPNGQRCARPDDGSGLYLRTRPTAEAPMGKLVSGAAPPGCVVAQVGQQLEILTGGALLATPHVIGAPKSAGYSRMSAAHFIHLHPHTVLQPLAAFSNEATIRAYRPPVTAGTYAIKTLVDIGLAPASALDQLGYRHYDRLAEIRAGERSN